MTANAKIVLQVLSQLRETQRRLWITKSELRDRIQILKDNCEPYQEWQQLKSLLHVFEYRERFCMLMWSLITNGIVMVQRQNRKRSKPLVIRLTLKGRKIAQEI